MTNTNKTVDVAALELLCDKLDCGDANHRATAAQIRKAINGAKPQLPEGIEWPRFEDGELVKIDHDFMNAIWDKNGPDSWVVTSIEFESSGKAIIRAKDVFGKDCDKIELNRGERVKRPETEVLDADGVPIKVGDTVYKVGEHPISGERTVKSVEPGRVWFAENLSWAYPSGLTHRKPDTQEAIDDDLTLPPWEYCERHGIEIESGSDEATTVEAMCRHLLERQRKLMGGE